MNYLEIFIIGFATIWGIIELVLAYKHWRIK